MKAACIVLLALAILITNYSTSYTQTKSLYYQSFASLSVSKSNDTLVIEEVAIPSINGGDIGGQLLASPISGIIIAVIGGLAGYAIESSSSNGPSVPIAIGALAGYTLGSALGVYVAVRKDKYDPNFIALLGSSLLGEIVGLYFLNISNQFGWLAAAPFYLPPIFAIITLNAFQQKKSNIKIGFDVQQLPQPNVCSYGVKLQYGF